MDTQQVICLVASNLTQAFYQAKQASINAGEKKDDDKIMDEVFKKYQSFGGLDLR